MINAKPFLREILEAHDLTVLDKDQGLVCPGYSAQIEAWITKETVHPHATVVQLDVNTLVSGGSVMNECFAGFGVSREVAIGNAFRNFAVNSLHVLLGALWDRVDHTQIEIETWELSGKVWRAIIGPCGITHSPPDEPTISPTAMDEIRQAVAGENLTGEINWFRWYYADTKQPPPIFEALKNNEQWQAGEAALQRAQWPSVVNYWSARHFMILDRPVEA